MGRYIFPAFSSVVWESRDDQVYRRSDSKRLPVTARRCLPVPENWKCSLGQQGHITPDETANRIEYVLSVNLDQLKHLLVRSTRVLRPLTAIELTLLIRSARTNYVASCKCSATAKGLEYD